MDKTHPESPQAKNLLNYTLIGVGILLLVMGLPVLFATSQVARFVGEGLGQGATSIILGVVIIVAGAALLAVGLRRR